jgi:hypothetical protein
MMFVVEVRRSKGRNQTLHRAIIDEEGKALAIERADAVLAEWAVRGAKTVRVLDAKDREEVYLRAI